MADDDIFKVFLDEFDDFVKNMESELSNAKSGKEVNVSEIFRAFHTFKGNGALFEFKDFVTFSEKYTEHFRPLKDDKTLSDENINVLDKVIGKLKAQREDFKH